MRVTPDTLLRLQKDPQSIRNICIVAHVDHGKTSLSDSLLASNGIISQRLAGKVRYLDSRPDEQLRGITMESSAISLYFRVLHKKGDGEEGYDAKEHLINLIDSPGHIDFSSEVSTASRLCDGAVVLVDVVEGVCSQTVTVLRQCWIDKLKPILVLNKIDRLITELRLTPSEACLHLTKVVEQVNSVIGSFFSGERMAQDLAWREQLEKEGHSGKEFVEEDDKDIYFDPAQNNVIFSSAIDGWGFNISQMARFYENKLGIKRENLQKVLWGDFYLDPKTKKIIGPKGLKGRSLKPLFQQLVLENIWKIYENIVIEKNAEVLEKIVKALNIKVLPRDLRSKDNKALLSQVMGQWLPVSSAVLLTVTEKLPSPLESQRTRIPTVLESAPHHELIDPGLREAMLSCDNNGPVSAYVSKILSVPEDELPRNSRAKLSEDELAERSKRARELAAKAAEQAKILEGDQEDQIVDEFAQVKVSNNDPYSLFEYEEEEEEEEIEVKKEELIGFARVYSGTLRIGQELSVLEPKYDPANPKEHIQTATITELYLLMGKELVPLDEVPSGNIAGIGGLAGKILKNGTLIEPGIIGVNLAGVSLSVPPIVRVAVEPVNPTQMDKLERGLELLNQADPCVQTFLEDTGEHILATAGELHLERCLKDLKERFAGIEITASEPVIPYRETFIETLDLNPPKNPDLGRGVAEFELGNVHIKMRAVPLPQPVIDFLLENHATIKKLVDSINKRRSEDEEEEDGLNDLEDDAVGSSSITDATTFKKKLQALFDADEKHRDIWSGIVDRISVFGPKRTGPNILFDTSKESIRRVFSQSDETRFRFENSIVNGFQLSTQNGPLAHEPVQGMAIIMEDIREVDEADQEDSTPVPNLLGRLITTTRDNIHQALLDWSPRIMLAMYTCDIQASAEVLGKVYAVVQQKRGHIVSEEMKEGTPFFQIIAKLPVVEAFGFSEDIRKRTSGAAQPQLVFSGFESIDEDPFWVPTTEEEMEALGEFAERENIARKYMNQIRKRKGLFVDEKVVQNAEKQRTLKRN
ncbi:GTPase RIA1 [Cyberlindnera jadinii NRRL Y-1542]|uniref:Ribosome assembly protein 1 n=1 Tax=Cyberlindnera jadinii (strain ATCC 18201 / CBS 1600 / BCRC 20928 / JCM 3617 / NBRC 0987 / NRRL Y-1542) TaxID=983966 RepID=A0A1E4RXZ4_CYBJN|nr:P-loop containing nucleoside triphosphate hydrolase protein [Cyberlindnera jadinii NRRL Y-1542]ODV72100.1 P-loop containing nucleoside triphosphate hydrolase protein [Cyberlindnera jadinii NRRL Y-1542]